MVVVAALSQHAVGAVRERGEEASRGGRLQAGGAVGARGVAGRARLWKERQQTGAASADSHLQPGGRHRAGGLTARCVSVCVDVHAAGLPRNCRTLVRVLRWAALVLGRRVP